MFYISKLSKAIVMFGAALLNYARLGLREKGRMTNTASKEVHELSPLSCWNLSEVSAWGAEESTADSTSQAKGIRTFPVPCANEIHLANPVCFVLIWA